MSNFYKPIISKIYDVQAIIYPMKGIENTFNRNNHEVLEEHVKHLHKKHLELKNCQFQIIIMWEDNSPMTDIWLFKTLESEESGFTVDCETFRSLNEEHGEGITASDGLILLGRETEFFESVRKSGDYSLKTYFESPRPKLPGDLNPTESFYT